MHSPMTQTSSIQNPVVFVTGRASNFTEQESDFKNGYSIPEDETNVLEFVKKYQLEEFLAWVHAPITSIFGNVEKTLSLFQCWDENEPRLILTICSNMEDLDEMMELESQLFIKLDRHPTLLDAISHVTIEQN